MSLKTYDEIVQSLRSTIASKRPDVNTQEGSISRDVFVNPPAQEIEEVFVEIENNRYLNSLFFANLITIDQLDALVYNYGVTRKPAEPSGGNVVFYKTSAPNATIQIPIGTQISTQKDNNLNSIKFETTALGEFTIVTQYNPLTGRWEVSVPVTCLQNGISGNVPINTVVVLASAIAGVNGVTNTSVMAGGVEQEDNISLAQRALDAIAGANIGTVYGYQTFIKSDNRVQDALLVGAGDILMVRDNGLGGKIDIYIKCDTTSPDVYKSTTMQFNFTNNTQEIAFTKQPLLTVDSVVNTTAGGTPLATNQYEVIFDNDITVFSGSYRAISKIKILGGASASDLITVTYKYFNILEDLQQALLDDRVNIITTDVLVRLAKQVDIDVALTAYPDETVTDKVLFANNIKTAIENALNSDSLANSIQQYDLLVYIHSQVTGIDKIILPFTKLCKSIDTGIIPPIVTDIALGKNEFSWSGTITVNVP